MTLDESQMEWFITKMTALQRRAERLGFEPPEYDVVETRSAPVEVDGEKSPFMQQEYDIRVRGKAPRIGGYEVVAKIDFLDKDNTLIRNITRSDKHEELPERVRRVDPTAPPCDHCGYRRRRKTLYVLCDADGEYSMVGTSCIRDYTGHHSPEDILKYAAEVLGLQEQPQGEPYPPDADPFPWLSDNGKVGLGSYLPYVRALLRHESYYSRTKARDNMEVSRSTADTAWKNMLDGSTDRGFSYLNNRLYHPTEEDEEFVRAALQWVVDKYEPKEEAGGINTFEHNLLSIARAGAITRREIGYAAWIMEGYQRHLNRRQRVRGFANEWIQPDGEGYIRDVGVRVERIIPLNSRYGPSKMFIMQDLEGRSLVWVTSTDPDLEVGAAARIERARFKKHAEYKGRKQTHIKRIKLSEE